MGRLNAVRRLLAATTLKPPLSSYFSSPISRSLLISNPLYILEPCYCFYTSAPYLSRSFCSSDPSGLHDNDSLGPVAVDYSCVLEEDEFHKLADSTIHHLLEKIEEYGDSADIDGFDIDYGNQVLTAKFGNWELMC